VIALTANAMEGDRSDVCKQAWMTNFQPIAPKALMEVLDKWLGKAGKGTEKGARIRKRRSAKGI
jgi:hypothetical protein